MEELRIVQLWTAGMIGGVVGLGLLYLRRFRTGRTARLWSWAWLCFFASLVASGGGHPMADVSAHTLGTAFSGLMLAGALAFANIQSMGWIVPASFAVGAVRGVAHALGFEQAANMTAIAVEAPAHWIAAAVLLRSFRGEKGTPAIDFLAVLTALFGFLEISNVIWLAPGNPPFTYFAAGSTATLLLALTQVFVLLERAGEDHTRDLELLREVAQSGATERRAEGVITVSLEALQRRLDFDAAAVWLLSEDGKALDCVYAMGVESGLPADLVATTSERPLPKQALGSGEPIFIDDIRSDDADVHPYYGQNGFRSGALFPLQQSGNSLGILVVGRKVVRPFHPEERRILSTLSLELSLALQHVRAIERLASERRTLRSIIEASPTGILVCDDSGRVALLNRTLLEHLAASDGELHIDQPLGEIAERVAERFSEPDRLRHLLDASHSGLPGADDVLGTLVVPLSLVSTRLSEERPRDLLVFSSPIRSDSGRIEGRVWVTSDVSDERQLEDQLRQSQKIETLGTLAGGIAHDFNNQLTAILGNVRLLAEEVPDNRDARESLHDLEHAAQHCANLTRALLSFARRTPLAQRSLELEEVLQDVEALLSSLLPSTVDFVLTRGSRLPRIQADPTQLQQILINLVINARDAIEAKGRIHLHVSERSVSPSEAATRSDATPGDYLVFSVQDDGCGMDESTRRRIFDPFFTTKPTGEGTGLGLAVVYGAVRAHGGWVELDTAVGSGSTFRVLLPAASSPLTTAEIRVDGSVPTGDETILLAEDEAGVRRLLRILLEGRGFRVIEATNGQEAVTRFLEKQGEIDLVLFDVTMPELDGVEALRTIRSHAPTVPAILASGLGEVENLPGEAACTRFVAKPFEGDAVVREVRRCLDAASG